MLFEKLVWSCFEEELRRGDFDVVHRVTPLSPTMGSPLATRTPVPMILGPLNGGLPWPREYPELRRQEREWLVPLRKAYRYLPYYRSAYRRLAGVIAGSRHTATEVPAWFRGRRFYVPENGIDPERFPLATAWPEPNGRFRFVTVGRLVPYKGFSLILEAMRDSALLRECDLDIIGDGPERENLANRIREYGMERNVRVRGWVDQKALARAYGESQVFVFPSLREFGGGVVLEAMASGLPAIVVDHGGPPELVGDLAGIRLPLVPRAELVPLLRNAMETLVGDPARCRAMSCAGRERVMQEFTWTAKAAQMVSIYESILQPARQERFRLTSIGIPR